jgi:hypothetical protein
MGIPKIFYTLPNFMLFELPKPVAVVAHDAGGANQIIALIQAEGNVNSFQAYLEGPALKLWLKAFPHSQLHTSLEGALDGCQSLLTGTGWASNLEYNAIYTASASGIHITAVLDHWVNYDQRFTRDGHVVRPSEFWVVDQYALTMAIQSFPDNHIRQVPDYYLQNQVQEITQPSPEEKTLLYILEPARSKWGKHVAGEFQALHYMIEKLPDMCLPQGIRIQLRPHPSENREKYRDWISQHADFNVSLDDSPTLADAISKAQWVAGCESYALVVALAVGRTVFCTLPPWAPACRLPHQGLIQLKSLLS